ncbi:sulfotransferase [Candidatus Saccharibacteria bacterium]|nr:sulfotransferase [Candidatus Saccharibacteria bacterium]
MKRHLTPVVVAGCPRSGSTILAHMLALSRDTIYLEEPLNHETGVRGADEPFLYLNPQEPNDHYDAVVQEILGGKATFKRNRFQPKTKNPARWLFYKLFINRYNVRYNRDYLNPLARFIISKDPTATLATEYLAQRFGYKVVLTVRHPCGVAVSHQRLGWGGPVTTLLRHKELVRQLSKEVEHLNPDKLNDIERLAWYWRIVNESLILFARRNPDMIIVEHETFSRQPVAIVEKLYASLDMRFTDRIRCKVQALTSGDNPTDPRADRAHTLKRNSRDNIERWRKHLDQKDIDTIMKICGPTYKKIQELPNILSV